MSGPTLLDLLRKTEIFGEMSPEELNALLRVLGGERWLKVESCTARASPVTALQSLLMGASRLSTVRRARHRFKWVFWESGMWSGAFLCGSCTPLRNGSSDAGIRGSRTKQRNASYDSGKVPENRGSHYRGYLESDLRTDSRDERKGRADRPRLLEARKRQGVQSEGASTQRRPDNTLSKHTRSALPPHYPLESRDLQLLSSVGVARTLSDGEVLCEEGDPGDSAYFLTAGHLDVLRMVSGSPRLLATIPMGGVVGQLALLDQRERSATLRARGPVRVLGLNRDTFLNLIERSNSFALRFQEHVCVTGIRQLRSATQLLSKIESVMEDQARKVESGEQEDIKPSFVSAALNELDMTIEDLDDVVVKTPEGQMSAAEIRARSQAG